MDRKRKMSIDHQNILKKKSKFKYSIFALQKQQNISKLVKINMRHSLLIFNHKDTDDF